MGFWSHPSFLPTPNSKQKWSSAVPFLPRGRRDPRLMSLTPPGPSVTLGSPVLSGPLPRTSLCGVSFGPSEHGRGCPGLRHLPSESASWWVRAQCCHRSRMWEPDPVVNSHLYAACFCLTRLCRGDYEMKYTWEQGREPQGEAGLNMRAAWEAWGPPRFRPRQAGPQKGNFQEAPQA